MAILADDIIDYLHDCEECRHGEPIDGGIYCHSKSGPKCFEPMPDGDPEDVYWDRKVHELQEQPRKGVMR